MDDIVIKYSSGWDECDDCGSYDYGFVQVLKNEETILDYDWDGHLGGGSSFDDWRTALTMVLKALGYTVTIEEEDEDHD